MMKAKREIAGRARSLTLSDEMAAQVILSDGNLLVTPNGLKQRSYPSARVHLGWGDVSVPLRDGRAAYTVIRGGKQFVRSGRMETAKEKLFWTGDDMTDAYFLAYVEACGFPSLEDFEATLFTPAGDPHADQAERSARKRAARFGYGHEMESGWFLRLYRQQRGLCALSGLPMMRRNGALCECLPVPDRIDSKQGYIPDNVRLVRHGLNMMRRDRDDENFARLCASMFLLRPR